MIAAIRPVQSLLLAIFMLMAGSGFLSTLISLRLERAGAGTMAIGAVATAYFGGLVVGALRAGGIVRQVGHIRAFAAFVALLSASTLSYVLLDHPLLWTALRLIDGVCVAGVFICLESWLNDRADVETRGSILAAYMVALYSGQAVGQLLLGASGTLPAIPFQIASILISLAIIVASIPLPWMAVLIANDRPPRRAEEPRRYDSRRRIPLFPTAERPAIGGATPVAPQHGSDGSDGDVPR